MIVDCKITIISDIHSQLFYNKMEAFVIRFREAKMVVISFTTQLIIIYRHMQAQTDKLFSRRFELHQFRPFQLIESNKILNQSRMCHVIVVLRYL